MDDPMVLAGIITGTLALFGAIIKIYLPYFLQKKKEHGKIPQEQDELVVFVDEILEDMESMLDENQRVLSPLFLSNPNIRSIGNNFKNLYNNQRHRGNFGKWSSYLKTLQAEEKDSKIKEQIDKLLVILNELHKSFYKTPQQREINHLIDDYHTKVYLIDFIDGRATISQMQTATQNYLNFLRESTEKIGDIAGKLKATRSK